LSSLDARLLATLRATPEHFLPSDLASLVGADLLHVRERLAELGRAGFEFEDRPGFGIRLIAAPDRLIADDLSSRLGASALVREILVFQKTSSTNDAALQRGREGAAGGVLILAEEQESGRGRFGRRWESPAHRGLWLSLLLRPPFPQAQWPRLTTWAAVSIAAAIDETTRQRTAIKWPNDVQFRGKKLAGILVESGSDRSGEPFAVLGIGINVNHELADFPPELAEKAGSLRELAGRTFDRTELAAQLIRALERRWLQLEDDFPGLVAEAARRSSLLGKWVQFQSGAVLREGIAEALDADGHLLLRTVSGTLECLTAGEVTLVAGR
jgi:BirA family biotin operon repressor/biotin-[acetyl-CoA-carboxylase] ligase